MALLRWPATLPQSLHIHTEIIGQDGFVETPMAQGAARRWRRFSAVVTELRPPQWSTTLTSTQKAALESFYNDDLQNGALGFLWTSGAEPVAGVGVGAADGQLQPAYQLISRPSYRGLRPDATAANVVWVVTWAFYMLSIGHPGYPEFE